MKLRLKRGTVIFGILALLCMLYGIAVLLTGSGTGFFAVWFAAALMTGAVGAAYQKNMWARAGKVSKTLFLNFFGIALLWFLVTQALVISGFTQNGKADLDYIIVLGAQVKENGPGVVTKYRLDKAIEYLNDNSGTKVIVSGGQGANEPAAEAKIMAQYLIENGISQDRILQEDKSLDTSENIAFSSRFLNIENDTAGIVTNNFHVYRGTQLARHYGYKNVCGIAAGSTIVYLPNNMLRESIGITKDLLFGNLYG